MTMKKKKLIIMSGLVVLLVLGGVFYKRQSTPKPKELVKDVRVQMEGTPFEQADFKLGQYLLVNPKESTSLEFSVSSNINYFVKNYGEGSNLRWFQSDYAIQSFDKKEIEDSQSMNVRKVESSNIIVNEMFIKNGVSNETVITNQGVSLNVLKVLGESYPLKHILLSYSLADNKELTIMSRRDDQPLDKVYDVMLTDADGTLLKKMSLGDFVLENFETSIHDLIKNLEVNHVDDIDKLIIIARGIKTDGKNLYFYNFFNQTIYMVDAKLEKRQHIDFVASSLDAVELTYVPTNNQFLVEKKYGVDSSFSMLTPDLKVTAFDKATEVTGYFVYHSTMFVSSLLENKVKYVNFSDKKVLQSEQSTFGIAPVFSEQGDMYFENHIKNEEEVRDVYTQLGINLVDEDFSESDKSSATIFVKIDEDKLADFFELIELVEYK